MRVLTDAVEKLLACVQLWRKTRCAQSRAVYATWKGRAGGHTEVGKLSLHGEDLECSCGAGGCTEVRTNS